MNGYNGYWDEFEVYLGMGRGGVSQDMARAQVQALKRGEWTNTLFEAIPEGERNRVRVGASTVGFAATKVIYWLAVLGRVERNTSLLPKIQELWGYTTSFSEDPAEIGRVFAQGILAIADKHDANAKYVRTTLQSQSSMTRNAISNRSDEGGVLARGSTLLTEAPSRAPGALKRGAKRWGKNAKNALEQESKTAKGVLWGVGLTLVGLTGLVIYLKVSGTAAMYRKMKDMTP